MIRRTLIAFFTSSYITLTGCQQTSNAFLGKWRSTSNPKVKFIIYREGPQSPHFPMETEDRFILEYSDDNMKSLDLQYFPLKHVMLGIKEDETVLKLEFINNQLKVVSSNSGTFGSSISLERAD